MGLEMMHPYVKILGIYAAIFIGGFFVVGSALAFGEITLKIKAMFGARKGRGVAEIIKGNGRVSSIIVDFSKDEISLGRGQAEKKYDLKAAKENPMKFIKIKWIFVPVVTFREDESQPLPMSHGTPGKFNREYFNTAIKVAYLSGATNPLLDKLETISKFLLITMAAASVTALVTAAALPVLMPIIQGLWQAKNAGVLENFAPKFIEWLS